MFLRSLQKVIEATVEEFVLKSMLTTLIPFLQNTRDKTELTEKNTTNGIYKFIKSKRSRNKELCYKLSSRF